MRCFSHSWRASSGPAAGSGAGVLAGAAWSCWACSVLLTVVPAPSEQVHDGLGLAGIYFPGAGRVADDVYLEPHFQPARPFVLGQVIADHLVAGLHPVAEIAVVGVVIIVVLALSFPGLLCGVLVRRERRAVVWPVSWLVRGRAWPGGRTLAWRGRAALARPLWVRPGPPALPGEGPAPGRWVKNRTTRHHPPTLFTVSGPAAGPGPTGPSARTTTPARTRQPGRRRTRGSAPARPGTAGWR